MSLYTLVIVNPASANGATARRWPELRRALDRVLSRWDNQFTVGPGDAIRLARDGVRAGYEQIVAVGGDGTMNEVVSGLFPEDGDLDSAPIRSDIVISPIRQGTGGDFARYLGLSGDLPGCVEHLAEPGTRPVDLGRIALETPSGARLVRTFLNIASFGLSGVVVDRVNSTTKALGGRVSFALGVARSLVGYTPQEVAVRVDGAELYRGPIVTCAVANGQYFGGGMRIARDAEADDGLLDVTIQTRSGAREILAIQDLYDGAVADWPSVVRGRGTRVDAEPVDPRAVVLLEVDGEGLGHLPASVRLWPGAVRLNAPPRARR
jgi:YegS/Rv2252/BmrU family lipid kinase